MPAITGRLGRLASTVRLWRHVLYDAGRFRRAAFLGEAKTRENLKAQIHILAHMVEYGMALSDPRAGFGVDRVQRLIAETRRYLDRHGPDSTTETALGALAAYLAFNRSRGVDVAAVADAVATLGAEAGPGGTETVTAAAIRQRATMDFVGFMEARHSVRQYAPMAVDPAAIERAVAAAQQTPSSCNRQTCRAYAFTERPALTRVLALHEGNRGFGDQLGGAFIVTSDLAHWNDVGERNQSFVDGGMFAMTLALALHAEGLGAVMLNWSAPFERDRALRALVGIPDSEVVITLIGFGVMTDEFRVPVSRRKPRTTVLQLNPPLTGAAR